MDQPTKQIIFRHRLKAKALEEYKQDLAPSIHAVEQGQNIEDFILKTHWTIKEKHDTPLACRAMNQKLLAVIWG